MRLKSLLLTVVLAAFCVAAYGQQPSPQPKPQKDELGAKIRELIELSHGEKLANQMLDRMFGIFENSMPEVPQEVWEKLREKFDTGELLNLEIPIYEKYYTLKDVEGLIAFYKSPLGQKVLANQGDIMRDSMAVGMQYGRSVAEKVIHDLQQKGYKVPKTLKT
jgi:uncharacterized protein